MKYCVKLFAALGAGVVLCTALMHTLVDAIEDVTVGFGLESGGEDTGAVVGSIEENDVPGEIKEIVEEEEEEVYPYAQMITMVSLLVIFFLEHELTRFLELRRQAAQELQEAGACNANVETKKIEDEEMARAAIRVHVFEIAMAVHSVVIGFALGAMTEWDELRTLTIAISVHQFCEGFAVGAVVLQTPMRTMTGVVLLLIFTLTAPAGLALGIVVERSVGDRGEQTRAAVQGVLGSIAAGVLLYMALCDLLPSLHHAISPSLPHALPSEPAGDEESGSSNEAPPKAGPLPSLHHHHSHGRKEYHPTWLRIGIMVCVAIGVTAMAVLAKWA